MTPRGVIILTGPTCAGKSSVQAALHSKGLKRAVSHTTRAPRLGEVDGVDYHFVSRERFDDLAWRYTMLDRVDLPHASYGLLTTELERSMLSPGGCAMVREPHGAARVRALCIELGIPVVSAWIDCAPHIQAERFMQRVVSGQVAPDHATQRLADMLSIERDWRREAVERHRYDAYMLSNRRTPEQLADDLISLLVVRRR